LEKNRQPLNNFGSTIWQKKKATWDRPKS